jgi:hypothetical protein
MWLGTAIVAGADEFVVDSTRDLTLKAPGGKYQAVKQAITPTGPSALRARITLSKFEDHPDWSTSFHLAVMTDEETFLAFQIVQEPDQLTAYIRRLEKGSDETVSIFDFKPVKDETFTLLMAWTEAGKLTASVGRDDKMETLEAEFGHRPEKLRILASGGTMDLKPLELGHMGAIISSLPATSQPLSAKQGAMAASTDGACATPAVRTNGCTHHRPPAR